MKVALVACGKSKLDCPAPAHDLYTGQLFRASRAWAEANCDRWYILSAKHGLVDPETVLEPYNETLNGKPYDDIKAWALRVNRAIAAWLPVGETLVVLAGRAYRYPLVEWLENDYLVEVPLVGLGIGQQLAWLKQNTPTVKASAALPVTLPLFADVEA